MKYSPEVMLYMADSFASMDNFDKQKVYKFFEVRYIESLKKNFNEEQLYYYYAIKIFGFEDIVAKGKKLVLISNNQILISYYLQDGIFEIDDIDYLKTLSDEQYWFQNYHLILCCAGLNNDLEESIEKYLVPQKVKLAYCDKQNKLQKRQSYIDFYKKNLENGKYIIRNISNVKGEIIDYLNLKIAESEEFFEK